jgi:hypothetical protein
MDRNIGNNVYVNVNHFHTLRIGDYSYTPAELGQKLKLVSDLEKQIIELKEQINSLSANHKN